MVSACAVELLFRRWKAREKDEQGLLARFNDPQLRISDLEDGLYHAAYHAHSSRGQALAQVCNIYDFQSNLRGLYLA